MSDKAILDKNHNVVEIDDIYQWGEAFENKDRRVAHDEVDGYRVSTVFLGLDHSYGIGPKLWFETMIFPMEEMCDLYCERYTTWDEAMDGHLDVVEKVKSGELPIDANESTE